MSLALLVSASSINRKLRWAKKNRPRYFEDIGKCGSWNNLQYLYRSYAKLYMMGDGTRNQQHRRCNIRKVWFRTYLTDSTDRSRKVLCVNHRVHRVPGFLSSRPNWLPPPFTHKRVLPPPPPLLVSGGGAHSLAGKGAGRAHSDEGRQTLGYSSYL